MTDPKDNEVRREVGWVDGRFVELVLVSKDSSYELVAMIDGEKKNITETKYAIDALVAMDTIEYDVFREIQKQGVAV